MVAAVRKQKEERWEEQVTLLMASIYGTRSEKPNLGWLQRTLLQTARSVDLGDYADMLEESERRVKEQETGYAA